MGVISDKTQPHLDAMGAIMDKTQARLDAIAAIIDKTQPHIDAMCAIIENNAGTFRCHWRHNLLDAATSRRIGRHNR